MIKIIYILIALTILLPMQLSTAATPTSANYIFTASDAEKLNLPNPPDIPQKMVWALSSSLRTHYILDEVVSPDSGKTLNVYVRSIFKRTGEFTDSYIHFDTVNNRYRILRTRSHNSNAEPINKQLVKTLDWRIARPNGLEEKLLFKIKEVYSGKISERQNEGIKQYTPTEWQKIRQEAMKQRFLKATNKPSQP